MIEVTGHAEQHKCFGKLFLTNSRLYSNHKLVLFVGVQKHLKGKTKILFYKQNRKIGGMVTNS